MNKSFPTAAPLTALMRGFALLAALSLGGCATYYPDSGYGSVYESRSDDGYYSGGGRPAYDDRYYDDGYYGPAYGPTTIYFEHFSPGYYYRPGYGYYVPAPRYRDRDRDNDHDRGNNNGRGWVDKGRELNGDNPGRDRPHSRDNDRNDDRRSGWTQGDRGDRNDRSNRDGNPGYRPPENAPANNGRGPDRDRGWSGKGRELESRPAPVQPRQLPQAQAPQQPVEGKRRPKRDDDRGWAGKGRDLDNDR